MSWSTTWSVNGPLTVHVMRRQRFVFSPRHGLSPLDDISRHWLVSHPALKIESARLNISQDAIPTWTVHVTAFTSCNDFGEVVRRGEGVDAASRRGG
jgi:hypothetical protein